MTCTETRLKGIVAITAIPVAQLSYADAAQQLLPLVTSATLNITFANAVGIGSGKSIARLTRQIPTIDYAEAKDSEDDAVAGRSHSVSVSADIDDDDATALTWLLTLEREAHHLLLTLANGRAYLVAATADSYKCSVSRETNKTSIEFHIHNLMGLQRLTDIINATA